MKKRTCLYCFLVILVFVFFSCTSKKSPPASDKFIGDWYTVKGDVQVYGFYHDSTGSFYAGSLHDRLVIRGSWKTENNKFVLTPEYETGNSKPIFYDFLLKSDTLYFNNGDEIYTKTVPLYVTHPELEILEKFRWDLGLKFNTPAPAKLDWHDGTFEGYSVIIESKLGSEDRAGIYACLEGNGFVSDPLMASEICDGFAADSGTSQILLTTCSSEDPESTDGSFTITITVAMRKY